MYLILMSRTFRVCFFILLVRVVLYTELTFAQQGPFSSQNKKSRFVGQFGIEYLGPIDRDRQIKTTSLNLFIEKKPNNNIPIHLAGGVTATYAWGNILQFNESFQDIKIDNSAFGIGPVGLLRFGPLQIDKFALFIDGIGGVIFYSENFPAGGDFYNFMWRLGPTLEFNLNKNYAFNVGYKWMHVSNGQGVSQKNPSYNARGISLNIVMRF